MHGRQVERVLDGLKWVGQDDVLDQPDRVLRQQARGPAGAVQLDGTAVDGGRQINSPSDEFQRYAVQGARVSRGMLDPHRAPVGNRVEPVPVRLPPAEQQRAEPGCDDPRASRQPVRDVRYCSVNLAEAPRARKVGLRQPQTEPDAVRVHVVEARHDGGSPGVDGADRPDGTVGAGINREDPPGVHDKVTGTGVRRVLGEDPSVADQQVGEQLPSSTRSRGVLVGVSEASDVI